MTEPTKQPKPISFYPTPEVRAIIEAIPVESRTRSQFICQAIEEKRARDNKKAHDEAARVTRLYLQQVTP